MEATNFTREELAQYILHTAKDSVISKIKSIVYKEEQEHIVGYTVDGKPLNANQYKVEIQKGIDDIKAGKVTLHQDLLKEIQTW